MAILLPGKASYPVISILKISVALKLKLGYWNVNNFTFLNSPMQQKVNHSDICMQLNLLQLAKALIELLCCTVVYKLPAGLAEGICRVIS